MHLGCDPKQWRRGADEADLPPRQRKDLAGAADSRAAAIALAKRI